LCGQGEDEIKIVIGGDTIEPLKSTAVTGVYDYILPVWTLEATNRPHGGTTGTHPISWFPVIDVTGVQAKGTVIAVMPSGRQWTDETPTVPALEHLLRGLFIARLATLI
jgi:hypothetical protein